MRPGRILLFLVAVILTLSVVSLVFITRKPEGSSIAQTWEEAYSGHDSSLFDTQVKDTTTLLPPADTSDNITELTSKTNDENDISAPPAFFPGDALRDSIKKGDQVRILFYGDSQVEGDRVTSLLRQEVRSVGGGTGPGMLAPLMPVMYARSFIIRSSSNWRRYTLLDYRNGVLPYNRLGPMLALCRFTPPGETCETRSFASVKIDPAPGADEAVSKYDKLRILYGNNYDTVLVSIRSGASLIDFAMLQKGEGPLEYSVPLPSVSDVIVEFTGNNSPDIYALSLESESGVIVDNIPVRGSAGLEFVMTDIKGFEGCFEKLRPDMIFMQFGLNVVRNVRSEYHYYEEGLVKQIEYLQKASGNVPIILISVTDMALRTNDTIRRFPNISAIRDAQKNAAARTGVIFWDAWESMGGGGSVLKWYNHLPPLVSGDLTHLSNAGVDTIAARLYADLLVPGTKTGSPDKLNAAEQGYMPAGKIITADNVSASDAMIKKRADNSDNKSTLTGRKQKEWISSLIEYHPNQSFIFTTAGFWIFFLVVMAGFALVHRRREMCHTWLLMVSLYFYYRAGGLFIILLLFTTVITYLTAQLTGKAKRTAGKKLWLITNVVFLLGFLAYFKYTGFITGTVNSIFHTSFVVKDIFSSLSNSVFGTSFNVNTIVLPVGISFFTFQALSYSIDVYKGRMTPVNSFIDFTFYLTFFPQLVSGPIVRASEFIPQMRGEYTINRNEFGYGLFLILQGLIKKMLISDVISVGFVDRVFNTPALFSGFENLMAVFGYGLQIYCDFSGYTDIAIGVAMLMGFRLPLNFNSPYKAANVSDFWKRWHISLSRWLKDYLYIPLGGNRKGTIRTGINLMITMLLGGLWHGAAMRFIIWGGLHGVALIADKIWLWISGGMRSRSKAGHLTGILITFIFVNFAWIFFRSETMEGAGVMLTQIFSSFRPGNYGSVMMAYLPVIVLIISGYVLHFLPVATKEAYRGLFIKLPLVVKFVVIVVVVLLLHKVGPDVVQPFIYFRF